MNAVPQLEENGVTVWHFTTVEEDVEAGEGTVIGSCCFIGRGSRIGRNVHIQHGAFIARGSVIGDDVFIGPNAVLTDDKRPVAGKAYKAQPPYIANRCSIGAGAVIMPGVVLAPDAMVGAGAVVVHRVDAGETVVGIPARQLNHFM